MGYRILYCLRPVERKEFATLRPEPSLRPGAYPGYLVSTDASSSSWLLLGSVCWLLPANWFWNENKSPIGW